MFRRIPVVIMVAMCFIVDRTAASGMQTWLFGEGPIDEVIALLDASRS